MAEVLAFPQGAVVQEKTNVHLKLKIHEKFRTLIHALKKDEFEGLEEQIIEWGGARDPIVTWNGYIVEGHHRYKICTKHDLPFQTVEGKFKDEDHALVFIMKAQIKKRNCNDFEKSVYIIEIKKVEERIDANIRMKSGGYECKGSVKHPDHNCGQGEDMSGRVDRVLSKEVGVSHNTVSKVSKILDCASEETKQQLKNDKLSIHKAYTDIKRKEVAQSCNFPKGEYRILHADPYTRDNTVPCGWNDKAFQFNISNLPVKESLDSDDAVLFLWTPPRYIDYSFSLMKAWGFAYRRMFIWDHCKYFDNNYMSETHHLVFLCTKFDCHPDTDVRPMSILHDTGEDTRYDQFSKVIESLYTHGDKLELFMDKKREGWDLFTGNGED